MHAESESAPPSVLVIEDHALVGPLLRRLLIAAGFEAVEVVRTARKALESLRSRRVDLAIIDVTLLSGDLFRHGFEAGAEITRRFPTTRLLYISGHPLSDLSAAPAGAVFLQKPFDRTEFLAKITEAMQQQQPPRAEGDERCR